MELTQIRHFIAVAEAGGFTKGAQRAAVSQQAISASIARLEVELDVKLLDRRRSQWCRPRPGCDYSRPARRFYTPLFITAAKHDSTSLWKSQPEQNCHRAAKRQTPSRLRSSVYRSINLRGEFWCPHLAHRSE